jgi:hypothetical protein
VIGENLRAFKGSRIPLDSDESPIEEGRCSTELTYPREALQEEVARHAKQPIARTMQVVDDGTPMAGNPDPYPDVIGNYSKYV